MFFIYGLVQLFIPLASNFYIFVLQLSILGKLINNKNILK